MEQEIEIDPTNAGGRICAGRTGSAGWFNGPRPPRHFSRATKLDAGFGDAYLGLGSSLIAEKKFPEAIPPLETAVKLEPANPATQHEQSGGRLHPLGAQAGGRKGSSPSIARWCRTAQPAGAADRYREPQRKGLRSSLERRRATVDL